MKTLWLIPHWEWWAWLLLILGGLGTGFINTLAGGGSLLTLPFMIFLGIPPHIANATNRFALAFQTGSAALGFRRSGIKETKTLLWIAGPGLFGGWVGVRIAIELSPDAFRQIFALLLVLAALPAIMKPHLFRSQKDLEISSTKGPPWLLMGLFFFVGMYSGFIQIGSGLWSLLALLVVGGFSINQANSLKVQLLCMTTSLATIVFLWHDQVILLVAVILSLANALGSWIGIRLVRKREILWIRWLLLGSALAASLRLINII